MQKPYGIVVCGGKSIRMGMDKYLLDYHGKPQWKYVYEMLGGMCDKVLISCNITQTEIIDFSKDALIDLAQYQEIGPMAALLTAFEKCPDKDFLIVGCDYPFITTEKLNDFLIFNDGKKTASAFYNLAHSVYEPLLAWYSHHSRNELLRMFKSQEYSLQHFLKESEAGKFVTDNIDAIMSVDTPEDYKKAKTLIENLNQP